MTARPLLLLPLLWSLLPLCGSHRSCSQTTDQLATFNTALTPLVNSYEARRKMVPRHVKEIGRREDIDFFCFQEVWFERDMVKMMRKLRKRFAFHYSPIHADVSSLGNKQARKESDETAACGSESNPELLQLQSCVVQNCAQVAQQSQLGVCMRALCGTELYGLSSDCRACVTVSATDFATVLRLCANSADRHNRFNPTGLFIASRRPIESVDFVKFLPESLPAFRQRGYISVQVNDRPAYVCTHLTSDVSSEPYVEAALPYNSYREQNRAEILAIQAVFATSPHVLMGDLSTGPAQAGTGEKSLTGEMKDNYALLGTLGYTNPYLHPYKGRCTLCEDVQGPKLTDHILVMNVDDGEVRAKRILDRKPVGYLSDHFAIWMDICLAMD